MIITDIGKIPPGDPGRFGWASLSRFHNVDFVAQQIINLHTLGRSQHDNARKQARQIRYCLLQAAEYHRAASSVTLATKPLLLYYSLMSLALAEILMKQSGGSSLDKAREEHKHHGLKLKVGQHINEKSVADSASALRAEPMIVYNQARNTSSRVGTFELWHRSAREQPLAGDATTLHGTHSTTTIGLTGTPSDVMLTSVPARGITLIDCLTRLPGMLHFLRERSISANLARGSISTTHNTAGQETTFTIILHPDTQKIFDSVTNAFLFSAAAVNSMEIIEGGNSCLIRHFVGPSRPDVRGSYPTAIQIEKSDIYFMSGDIGLNEFGLFYVSLFILGNYSRYYPDLWMKDVENSSELMLATQEFLVDAERRIPVLALSELSRKWWLAD